MGWKDSKIGHLLTKKLGESSTWKKLTLTSLATLAIGLASGSIYSAYQKAKLGGDYLPGYNGRIELNPFNSEVNRNTANNQKFGEFKLEGKTYNFDDPKILEKAIKQAADAFSAYNVHLANPDFVVNFSNLNTYLKNNATRALDLYFHAKSFPDFKLDLNNATTDEEKTLYNKYITDHKTKTVPYNTNKAWFDFVHLNQLSIDRYGFNYNVDGTSQTEIQPSLKKLVTFNNVGANNARLLTISNNKFDGISFNIYDQNISVEELRILANTDTNRYLIPSEYKDRGVANTFDVWLDKDLLTWRLNYIYATYVFNQSWSYPFQSVSDVIGNPNIASGQNDEQKRNYDVVRTNYLSLTSEEKQFAKDYIQYVIKSSNHIDDVNVATNPDYYIKSDDLITVYNRLKAHQGSSTGSGSSLSLFNGHLLAQISGGESGNWTKFFPKYDTEFNHDYQEKLDPTKPNELRPIFALDEHGQVKTKVDDTTVTGAQASFNNSANQPNQKNDQDQQIKEFKPKENVIHLAIDASITTNLNNKALFDNLTKYQVRYLTLRNKAIYRDANSNFVVKPLVVAGEYAEKKADKSLAVTKINFAPPLVGAIGNLFGSNINANWWTAIASIIFLTLVGIIVAWLYRVPGVISYGFWLGAIAATVAAFFALNLELTTNAAIGLIATIIMSLITLFTGLNYFVQQIRDGSSLKKASFLSLKRNVILNFDLFVIIFFTAIIFAFLAIVELSNFGLMLSIGVFINFFVHGIGSNLTNWLLVNSYIQRPGLFINKKNQVYLKSLSGQISADDAYAKKVVTKGYFNKEFNQYNQKFFVNIFSLNTLLYFGFIFFLLIVGMVIIFIPSIGFGSSFVLKNGTIIQYTIDNDHLMGGKQLTQAKSALSIDQLQALLGISFTQDLLANNPEQIFLKTTSVVDTNKIINLFSEWLQPNSYSIQKTTLFSATNNINSALKMILLSLGIISSYFILRFNWLSIIQLWVSAFGFLGFAVAIIALTRLTVTRNIVDLFLIIHIINLVINTWLLTSFRERFNKFHYYQMKDFYQLVWASLINNLWAFILVISTLVMIGIFGATFNWLELRYAFVYLLISLIALVLFALPAMVIIWIGLMWLRQKVFYNQKQSDVNNLSLRYRIKNHDLIDEQEIPGINFFGH